MVFDWQVVSAQKRDKSGFKSGKGVGRIDAMLIRIREMRTD
ncbi:hypothetical protein [Marinobacter sp. 2_MG-2023]|nr:hypothetical protein [Marinobacter sp. 2_MG-2023]MDO6442878.1 hypothetical protein [Marinobacter sp. 2_MG-2023]